MKFVAKDCDPTTGEPDDIQGFDDEYVVRYWIFLYTFGYFTQSST